MTRLLPWLLLAVAGAVHADDGSALRADLDVRQRIARERAEVQTAFAGRQRECATRFAVTSCVDEARSEQRAALTRLRDQELGLDEAQRRQRAAERLSLIEEKTHHEAERTTAAQAAAAAAPPSTPASATAQAVEPAPRTSSVAKTRAARPVPMPKPARLPKLRPDRSAQDASNRTAFEARQRAAQARRDAAQQREAERAKKGKVAPGLPMPASGAAR